MALWIEPTHHLDAITAIRARRARTPRRHVYSELHALADRAAPQIERSFRAAVAMTKQATLMAKLEILLTHRLQHATVEAIPWKLVGSEILRSRLTRLVQRLILRSAEAAQRYQPVPMQLRRDDVGDDLTPRDIGQIFNIANPVAVQMALAKTAKLVQGIDDETEKAIQRMVANAIESGRPPRELARDLRDMVGLNERQQDAIWRLRYQGASEIEVARAKREAINYRALMIARTETMRASNMGQEALWESADDAGVIDLGQWTREWVATPDERECPVCGDLDGQRFALGEKIQTEYGEADAPPIHPNCRCVTSLVPL